TGFDAAFVVPTTNVATIENNALVIEGVSRCRNALLNGQNTDYDWDNGYTCHQLNSGAITVQLPQPYMIQTMRLLLWDCDDRYYSYYIEVSVDQINWVKVVDRRIKQCRLLLWDCDDRYYSYYIEVSVDQINWVKVVDRRIKQCRLERKKRDPVEIIISVKI
ncbi:unnamed protein product, partial [Strongylus vulgaris]